MGLLDNLEEYRNKRMKQFHDAYEQLRQEMVNDLAKTYQEAGIPVKFTYKTIGTSTLQGEITGMKEFTESLVEGDEKAISGALSFLLATFVAMRDHNAAKNEISKDESHEQKPRIIDMITPEQVQELYDVLSIYLFEPNQVVDKGVYDRGRVLIDAIDDALEADKDLAS